MNKLNFIFLFCFSLFIVIGCTKEDTEPNINYPTIVGDWAIVQFNQTVISNGTVDESQTLKQEYSGTIKFAEDGTQIIDQGGSIVENTYVDKGEKIVVKGDQGELTYVCRQRSQNQLVFDITEKINGSVRKRSYVLERTSLEEVTSLVGKWLIVRLERVTKQSGLSDQVTTLSYAGSIEFKEGGVEDIELNHQVSHYTYVDRGLYLLVKDNLNSEAKYSIRIRTASKLVIDAVIIKNDQVTHETYILEKLQMVSNSSNLMGAWQIVRYDYTELINGVLNNNNTVSLNYSGTIYFNSDNKEKMVFNGVTYNNTYFDYGTSLLFNDGISKQNVIYTIRHRTAGLLLMEHSETINGKTTNQSFVLEKLSIVGSWNIDYFDQVVKKGGVIDNAQTVTRYNCGSISYYADGREVMNLSGTNYYNTYVDLGETLIFTDKNGDIWNYTFASRTQNKITISYTGTINGEERIQTYELTRY